MSNGTPVRVMSKDGKRVLFIATFCYERGGFARVFRCGSTTLVPASTVLPLKGASN